MQEDQYVAAGDQSAIYEVAGLKSASLICYDLRFPNGGGPLELRALTSSFSLPNGQLRELNNGKLSLKPGQLKTKPL